MHKRFLLCFLLLAASTVQQKTIVFDEPIDALSVGLPTQESSVFVKMEREWVTLEIEDESDPALRESNLVLFPQAVDTVTVRGDLDGITLHPIRVSKAPMSYALAAETFYRAPQILRRSDWGADDTFLYEGPQVTRSDEPVRGDNGGTSSAGAASSNREEDCLLAQKRYPKEFATARTVAKDANGKEYRWAQRYSSSVKLLVVHHTALKVTGDTRPGAERVRALYEYHANNRGWGDVGYHYLIDEDGVIYEGRTGGEGVVGGHVYCGNVGTVGIALLGNFEEEQPTLSQIQSLQWMLDHLAKTYGIDPAKNATYHGKSVASILRHKDLISTECPGYYLSNVITQVRSNVVKGDLLASVKFPVALTKKPLNNMMEARLSTRLADAGEVLSRRFFRAKRLVRTAGRQNTTDARLLLMQEQLAAGSNLQKQRAGKEAQRQRIASGSQHPTPNTQHPIRIRLTKEEGSMTSCANFDASPFLENYRGVVECRIIEGSIALINTLPLEDYLAGLTEEPDTEPYEKQKAFAIAARSYAAFYLSPNERKFPGMPYDDDDSPVRFQAYGGVTFAERNPRWVEAVRETAGKVIMKNGAVVKTPYFSTDDGRTRTPAENGWKDFPFAEIFSSKHDPWCEGLPLAGHGVGMSGCGAKGQANEGKTAEEILKYYYPETVIDKL